MGFQYFIEHLISSTASFSASCLVKIGIVIAFRRSNPSPTRLGYGQLTLAGFSVVLKLKPLVTTAQVTAGRVDAGLRASVQLWVGALVDICKRVDEIT